jgi:hypothetical protein
MKVMRDILIYVILVIALCGTAVKMAKAGALDETRCCVASINRDATGGIIRRADVLYAFRKIHPCPATGLTTGACPNWQINHILPLACFGRDEVSNLQWMPAILKSSKGTLPIDRWERKIYCTPQTLVQMPASGTLSIQ